MSFEMADNHLMFLVTLPFHDGCMIVRERPFNKEQAKNIQFFRFKFKICEKIAKIALKSKNNMIFACFLTVWMEASRRHFQTACLYPLLFLRQINSNLNLLLTVADYQHISKKSIRI